MGLNKKTGQVWSAQQKKHYCISKLKAIMQRDSLAERLTQSELAKEMGITQAAISSIFNDGNPTIEKLIQVLDAINVKLGTDYSLKDIDFK